jgi:hypothetical protein
LDSTTTTTTYVQRGSIQAKQSLDGASSDAILAHSDEAPFPKEATRVFGVESSLSLFSSILFFFSHVCTFYMYLEGSFGAREHVLDAHEPRLGAELADAILLILPPWDFMAAVPIRAGAPRWRYVYKPTLTYNHIHTQ